MAYRPYVLNVKLLIEMLVAGEKCAVRRTRNQTAAEQNAADITDIRKSISGVSPKN